MRILLYVLGGLVVVSTALSLVRAPYWWVRMFDFPRAQIAVIGLMVVGLMVVFLGREAWWEWGALALVAVAVAFQAVQMLPYTPLYPAQSAAAREALEGRTLRLVVSNVKMDNHDALLWLEVIHAADPDVLIAVETDDWWAEQTRVLHPRYPHRVEVPQDNTYGFLLFSKFPLHNTEVLHLVEETVPSIWTEVELPAGETFHLVAIHPRPPRPDLGQDSDLRDAELVRVARRVEGLGAGRPVIVAGDLNDVAWSHTTRLFQRLSGLLDPRIGRGLFSTFHAEYPIFRWPLDHVFHSDEFTVRRLKLLEPVGSDHFPILIELVLEPGAAAQQEEPEPDTDDREEARRVLEERAEEASEETPEERRERDREDR
jgi:endonuclease/exonuclease/phosphatase (EEP) superfamily protein YafD